MNTKYITLAIILLFISIAAYGQKENTIPIVKEELTLIQCREMALENNKRIAIADRDKDKSTATMQAYRTNFLPRFSAFGLGYYTHSTSDLKLRMGDINLFDPNDFSGVVPPSMMPVLNELSVVSIPDMNFRLKLNNTYIAGVSVEQPIYMGGKITSAYRMSKIGEEMAGLNRILTESEVILETDRAYWLCVQAVELRKSAAKYQEVVEEFHRVVNNAVEVGMKSRNDLMKVQVQFNQARLQLTRAENGVRLSRMNLCQLLGLPLSSEINLTQTFAGQVIHIDPAAGIYTRPEYNMLSKQIEFKVQEKRLARSEFMPTVGVRGSYNYMNGLKLNNERLFDDASFSAMVSVNIPLFHWGEGVKKVRAAEMEKKIAELQRSEMSEKMELELQQALNAYHEALLEVELTETALGQAEENMRMSRDHYEAGMETISDYLEAQTIWQNAQGENIIARAKLEISKAEYRKAAGQM